MFLESVGAVNDLATPGSTRVAVRSRSLIAPNISEIEPNITILVTTTHIPCISAEYSGVLRQEADLLHSQGFLNDEKLKMVKEGLSQYEALKEVKLDRGKGTI